MSDSNTALGVAYVRASQIVRLVDLFSAGEIGRDSLLDAIRGEAEAILLLKEHAP